jgi:hypothetical protein
MKEIVLQNAPKVMCVLIIIPWSRHAHVFLWRVQKETPVLHADSPRRGEDLGISSNTQRSVHRDRQSACEGRST